MCLSLSPLHVTKMDEEEEEEEKSLMCLFEQVLSLLPARYGGSHVFFEQVLIYCVFLI